MQYTLRTLTVWVGFGRAFAIVVPFVIVYERGVGLLHVRIKYQRLARAQLVCLRVTILRFRLFMLYGPCLWLSSHRYVVVLHKTTHWNPCELSYITRCYLLIAIFQCWGLRAIVLHFKGCLSVIGCRCQLLKKSATSIPQCNFGWKNGMGLSHIWLR